MINKTYLEPETVQKIQKEFVAKTDFPSAVLFKFLERDIYMKLREQIIHLYFKKDVVRTSHSYAVAKLLSTLSKVFNEKEFLDFCSSILNKKVKQIEAKAYSFTWKDTPFCPIKLSKNQASISSLISPTTGMRKVMAIFSTKMKKETLFRCR